MMGFFTHGGGGVRVITSVNLDMELRTISKHPDLLNSSKTSKYVILLVGVTIHQLFAQMGKFTHGEMGDMDS